MDLLRYGADQAAIVGADGGGRVAQSAGSNRFLSRSKRRDVIAQGFREARQPN